MQLQHILREVSEVCANHVTGGHAQGGKTCLYKHFGGAKAIFCSINLQVPDSIEEQNHAKFSLGGNAPHASLQVRTWCALRKLSVTFFFW